jgi:hypothetical protein
MFLPSRATYRHRAPGLPPVTHQLQLNSGVVNSEGERADMRLVDSMDNQTPYDLVIVNHMRLYVNFPLANAVYDSRE